MKARSIARELALLGVSQLSDHDSNKTRASRSTDSRDQRTRHHSALAQAVVTRSSSKASSSEALNALLLKALTTLSADAQESIETAEGEMQRGGRLILESETRTVALDEVRDRIEPAIPLVEAAINRVGDTLELLMFVQQEDRKGMMSAKQSLKDAATSLESADKLMAESEQKIVDIERVRSQIKEAISIVKMALVGIKKALVPQHLTNLISNEDIRSYAYDLLFNWIRHWQNIDIQLNDAMERWTIRRLARVDRDILRLAMIEIIHLSVPKKVAIDEAVEMAKRYSDEEGYRFINGVLRRTTDKLEASE